MVEKTVMEEDLLGLENEIDAAVDRLFVEKGGEPLKSAAVIPPLNKTVQEVEKEVEWELPTPAPISEPPLIAQPFERLETQLLSLEWEITKENLGRTAKEVLELQEGFRENPDISSILNQMLAILNFMIRNEEGIQPFRIQILLDAKETIKLLMRDETEEDIEIYKRLALAGIEARFSCLEEIRGITPPAFPASTEREAEKAEVASIGSELAEEIVGRMESFSVKLDEMKERINRHLSMHEESIKSLGASPPRENLFKTKVTVFKIGERLLGVESHKVFKLFKVPISLRENLNEFPTFRLKELDVKMINLENLFPVPESDREEERQILILKGDETYKGLLIDRVLNRLSGPMEQGEEFNNHLLGMIHWTYQNLPIRIPILDFEKI